MKVSAVLLARALVFLETFDLDPKGHIFFPDLVRELVARYQFQKFPTKVEELDETKGVEFLGGKAGNSVIQKMVIYNTGILGRYTREHDSLVVHHQVCSGMGKIEIRPLLTHRK